MLGNFLVKRLTFPKNWKIKKYHQKNGQIFFTVHYKSIFGWWLPHKTHIGYDCTEISKFDTEDEAKNCILNSINHNIKIYGKSITKIEEIKF